MANEFRLGGKFEQLDGLTVGGVNFPSDFRDIDRKYLYYTKESGMRWTISGVDLYNDLSGDLSYIINNQVLGAGTNFLAPRTNKYLMIGGSAYKSSLIDGGSDGKGTGLSGTIKGQLTIGLTPDDYSISGSTDNYGSSLTDHLSLSHKEIRITDVKEQDNNKYYPSFDGGLVLNTTGIYKRQSNNWINLSETSEVLKNKIIKSPFLEGDIKYSEMKTNIFQGYNSGTTSNTIEKVSSEEDYTTSDSNAMYNTSIINTDDNYYNYNKIYLNPIINTNDDYKNWNLTIAEDIGIINGTIESSGVILDVTNNLYDIILHVNGPGTTTGVHTDTNNYLSNVDNSYKDWRFVVTQTVDGESTTFYFNIIKYDKDSSSKKFHFSKSELEVEDAITVFQGSHVIGETRTFKISPNEDIQKVVSDSFIEDGRVKGELYSITNPTWSSDIYQQSDYDYLISFGYMKFLSSTVNTPSSANKFGGHDYFYHGWNIEMLNPYQKGVVQYQGTVSTGAGTVDSNRYYSDSIISVNNGKDELYGSYNTTFGLLANHSTKDGTNALNSNYYTDWTIELKNDSVSPNYIKTTIVTSTSKNVIITGTISSVTSNTSLILDSNASSVDDFYNNCNIIIETPTGSGIITDYTGSTRTITVTWDGTPTITTSTTYTIYGTEITLSDSSGNGLLVTGSKYILTPPSITGNILHVNKESGTGGNPVFQLEPPYSNISNFYKGWTIKCGNKISVIDTEPTIGALNSGTSMNFKNQSGTYKWNDSTNDNEEDFKNVLDDSYRIPSGSFSSSMGTLINTSDYRYGDSDYYKGWTLKTVNPHSSITIGTYSTGSGSSFTLGTPPLPTASVNSSFYIIPPDYTGWISFDNSANKNIIKIPSTLTYSHNPELSVIGANFFKGWNIELTHYTTLLSETIVDDTVGNDKLKKSSSGWIADEYKNNIVFVETGNVREIRTIISNTTDTLTLDRTLNTAPTTSTAFKIAQIIDENGKSIVKHQKSYISASTANADSLITVTCPELNESIGSSNIVSFILTHKTPYELFPPLRKGLGIMELEGKGTTMSNPSSKYILSPHIKGKFSKGDFDMLESGNSGTTKLRLSNEASMVNDFYKGWIIKTTNPDDFGVIKEYTGSTREITDSENFRNTTKKTLNTTYELISHTEGLCRDQQKLSAYASSIDDYYKGWSIVTRTPQEGSTKVNIRKGVITSYIGSSQTFSCSDAATHINTGTLSTYVLYPPKVIEVSDLSVLKNTKYTISPPHFNSYDNNTEYGENGSINESLTSINHKKLLDKNTKYSTEHFYNNWNIATSNVSGKIINYDNNTRNIISTLEEHEVKGKMVTDKILEFTSSRIKDYYKNWKILITSGTNAGKEAKIIRYNGNQRRISTLPDEFYTDNTSEYILYPMYHFRSDINTIDNSTLTYNEGSNYIIYPSEHLYGTMDAPLKLDRNSMRINNYYVGWTIIATTGGKTESSLIDKYNNLTRIIVADQLSTNFTNSKTSYYLTKDKHVMGKMRTPVREVLQEFTQDIALEENEELTLPDNNPNKDKTGYYEGWDAYVVYTYVTGKEQHMHTKVSYHDYKGVIGLPGIHKITATEHKITLVEPQKIILSKDAFPVDNHYKGWTINATTNGITQSSIITDYNGVSKVIKAPGLTNITTVSTIYTLCEPIEGTIIRNSDDGGTNMDDSNTIVLPSIFNDKPNYYKNWSIEINSDRKLIELYEVDANTLEKVLTLESNISPGPGGWSNTKFKLLTPDANYNVGIGYQSELNRTDGNNNISIGKFSGPLDTEGSNDDKLYIDSSYAPRGSNSFIYGDMFNCSLSLNSDVTISNNSAKSSGSLTVVGITSISNNTTSGSTTTGALKVVGGVGIGENLHIGGTTDITGITSISNNTTAGSTTTGALKVVGGVGIGENLHIGGTTDITGITSITNDTDSDATTTGALIVSGGVGIAKDVYIGGITSITNVTDSDATTTGALIVSGGVGIAKDVYIGGTTDITGITSITNNTDSDATTTGALIVSGGVGIAKDVYIGGTTDITGITSITNDTDSDATTTGALIVSGGVGIAKDVYLGGITSITNATESDAIATGALVVSGGVGIAKNVYIGGNTEITGNLTVGGQMTTVNSTIVTVNDTLIRLADENPSDLLDIGFYGKYIDTSTSASMQGNLKLAATASAVDDYYNGMTITTAGDVSETGVITAYDGTTKVFAATWADGSAPTTTTSTTYVISTSYYTGLVRNSDDGIYHLINSTTDPGNANNATDFTAWSALNVADLTVNGTTDVTTITAKTGTSTRGHGSVNQVLTSNASGNVEWKDTSIGAVRHDNDQEIESNLRSIIPAAGDLVTEGGKWNIAFGYEAGNATSTGTHNIFLGKEAGKMTTTGDYNIFLGEKAGTGLAGNDGNNNIVIGANALSTNTGGVHESICIGVNAGRNAPSESTIVGYKAGQDMSPSASETCLFGYEAGLAVEGTHNTYIGYKSGEGDITNTTDASKENTALGAKSAYSLQEGAHNTCIGFESGTALTDGDNNVLIGKQAGNMLTDGNNNICIGPLSGSTATGEHYRLYIDTGRSDRRGANSLISGQQYTDTTKDTLSFNANVTINKLNSGESSDGKLTVTGTTDVTTITAEQEGVSGRGTGVQDQVLTSNEAGNVEWRNAASPAALETVYLNGSATVPTIARSWNLRTKCYDSSTGTTASSTVGQTPVDGAEGNIAFGPSAGFSTGVGDNNIFLGRGAGGSAPASGADGGSNIVIGMNTGHKIRGNSNILLGAAAGHVLENCNDNIAIGMDALNGSTDSGKCVCIGAGAGLLAPSNSTIVGWNAGNVIAASAEETCLFGYEAGLYEEGAHNTYIGYKCGRGNLNNTTHASKENTAVGRQAMHAVTTGDSDTCIGVHSGLAITQGNKNTLLGYAAGDRITTGNNNICIGPLSGSTTSNEEYRLYIDTGARVPAPPNAAPRGANSLIYAQQRPASSASKDTISLNANVTIAKLNSGESSDGDLTVTGATTLANTTINGTLHAQTAGSVGDVLTSGTNGIVEWSSSGEFGLIETAFVGSTGTAHLYKLNLRTNCFDNADGSYAANATVGAVSNAQSNISFGASAGKSTGAGNHNIFLGRGAGGTAPATNVNAEGDSNIGIGYNAGSKIRGEGNILLGKDTGDGLLAVDHNIAIGMDALGTSDDAEYCVVIGKHAGLDAPSWSTIVGNEAGWSMEETALNTCLFGSEAGRYEKGPNNTYIGFNCGKGWTTNTTAASGNTGLGWRALYGYVDSTQNGHSGADNTCIGRESGWRVTSGGKNTLLGAAAGNRIITGNNNICIGPYSGSTTSNEAYRLYIDTGARLGTTPAPRGANSLISGIQYTGTTKDTLSLNANVTINNLNSSSDGKLTVTGTTDVTTITAEQVGVSGRGTGGQGQVLTSGTNGIVEWKDASGGGDVVAVLAAAHGTDVYKSNLRSSTPAAGTLGNGAYNIALGYGAGNDMGSTAGTFGDHNIFLGLEAGAASTNGNHNIFLGCSSGFQITADGSNYPDYNISIGGNALDLSTNTIGSVVIGFQAGRDASNYSTIVGYEAGRNIADTATETCLFGCMAGRNVNGTHNTYIGYQSGHGTSPNSQATLADSKENTALGAKSAYSLQEGAHNTCIGFESGTALTDGDNNVLIGKQAGNVLTTANNNICIGPLAGLNSGSMSGMLFIDTGVGNTATVGRGTNSLIYGNQSATKDTLSFNANVTIAGLDGSSDGKLTVTGDTTLSSNVTIGKSDNTATTFTWQDTSGTTRLTNNEQGNMDLVIVGNTNNSQKMYKWVPGGSTVITRNSAGNGFSAKTFAQVCFLPGTKITLSNKIQINIEKLKKGDILLSYKFDDMDAYNKSVDVLSWFSEDDTGEFTESEVTNIWSDKSPGYIILNDNLHVTHEHLIFTKVDDEYTWLSAKNIRKGDIVFTHKGEYEEITKIEKIQEEVEVYNLRVTSSAMNYFADSYLVHNASLCDECAAKNNKL
jgi:hypothetical protein